MYFFVLGRNPALSVVEILAVLARERIDYKISGYSREALLIETNEDLSQIFHELGGSIKFGKIINSKPGAEEFIKFLFSFAEYPAACSEDEGEENNPSVAPISIGAKEGLRLRKNSAGYRIRLRRGLRGASSPNDQKVYFGFSFYKLDDRVEESDLRQKQRELQKLAMEIKKSLRAGGQSARFVTSRERALSSVVVKTNKLLNRGTEFIFFLSFGSRFHGPNHGTAQFHSSNYETAKRADIIIGKTLAVQEFEEYQLRDYGRPRRDILRGMLPPKIAKIMINLAQASPEATILDPFCGEGTILTEAAILGYKNLIGTDVDPQAVTDSKSNLEWTARQYNVKPQVKIFAADVRNLSVSLQYHGLDHDTAAAVVTEPFLGPLLRGGESVETIQKIKIELEELYQKAFLNFSKILKPGGRIVFIFPVWRTKNGLLFIDLSRVLPKEFKIQNLCDMSLHGCPIAIGPTKSCLRSCLRQISHRETDHPQGDNLHKDYSNRGGIIWQRPDQKVLREIMVLKLET